MGKKSVNNMTWVKQKLGNITEIVSGGTPSSSNPDFWIGGDVNWATLPDLSKKYLFNTQRKITKFGLKNSSAKLLPINTIIFSSRATIGEISITKTETTTNQGSKNLICNPEKAVFEFIYYCLKYNVKRIQELASGATYKEINKNDLSNVEIDIPDLSDQKRIAGVLAVYDDLIDNNEKRIRILEEMAQMLYTEWFVKFKFPGCEKVKMIDSGTEYGMIPEGWEINKLRDVAGYVRGCSYSSDEIDDFIGEYYIVNLKSFNRGGGFRPDGAKYYTGDVNENQLLSEDDIVVAVTDMTNDRAVIARPARIPEIRNKMTFSADVVKIISNVLPNSFIYQLLSNYRFTETTKNKANGANVLHLRPDSILEYKALIPTKDLMTKFDVLCSKMAHEINKLISQTEISVKTRDILIPQLVTGKRDVK